MTQQQASPKASLARAVIVLLLAVAAFAAAFYFLDGMSLVDDLLGGGSETTNNVVPAKPTETTETVTLRLPPGMPEEFALRIWQEQIDSQANIRRLASGEVESMAITKVTQSGDRSTLDIVAKFSDGTSAPGKLGMRSFDGRWYFSYVSGLNRASSDDSGDVSMEPTSAVVATDDVDIPLLNTILEQQTASSGVLEEYATGKVMSVRVATPVSSAGTVTLGIEMTESHEVGRGQIVLISKAIEGEAHWFLAKFSKTQSSQ